MQDGVNHRAVSAYQECGLRYTPNPMQEEMYDIVTAEDCTVLLKAPTGSGKMEAIVVPALQVQRRLVLIYPALSLIEDQEMRLAKLLQYRSSMNATRTHALIVDTGAGMYRRAWVGGQEQGKKRRHLYHGDVILTTLDKFLYRFFGFGEPKKSYIYPLRLRYGRQPLFCFDEAHSYDDVAYTNFVDLIRAIAFNTDAPRDVVVMTATMPDVYEQDLLPLLTPLDYTRGEKAERLAAYYTYTASRQFPDKALTFTPTPVSDVSVFCQHIVSLVESRSLIEQRTIITVEMVETAVALYEILIRSGNPNVLLYHGRQPHAIRQRVYASLKDREGQGQGYLLVTTSAIEVGCDLNAHLLITQLCNPEQLVQRAGRCNRQGNIPDARIIVIGDRIPPFLCTLATHVDIEIYYSTLQEMARQGTFDPIALIGIRRKYPMADYRVQTMFTMLYEYVYQAERENKPLHEKGLVITRSWDPVVTLTTGWDSQWTLENELQLSMLRCSTASEAQLDNQCQVLVRYFDEHEECYKFEQPKAGGCAYHHDIVIRVPETYMDPIAGYVRVPKVFLRGRRQQGYQRWLRARFEKREKPGKMPQSQALPGRSSKAASRRSSTSSTTMDIWWWYLDKLPSAGEDQNTIAPDEGKGEYIGDE